jgi:two-component system, cell cycle sensor histidine kinase and response regulator CckA
VKSASSYQILLVEDNAGAADLVLEGLADIPDCPCHINHVTTLREALDVLGNDKVDIVILDLNVTDSHGLDTLLAVRNADPEVVIVVLSGGASHEKALEVLDAGAQDCVDKNASPTILIGRAVMFALNRDRANKRHKEIEHLVEANPDAVIVVNTDHEIRYVNEAAVELFGKSKDYLVGQPLYFSIEENKISDIEILRGREARYCQIKVVSTQWEDSPALLASIRDVTAQKVLAAQLQQAQKLQALGTLSAGIAHDLNNILHVVIGNAQLAQMMCEDDEINATINDIILAGQKGTAFVRRILDFSKKRESGLESVDLGNIIEEVVGLVRSSAPPQMQVKYSIPDNIKSIYADQVQVNQILLNLCTNAIQAIGDDIGEVMVSCDNVSQVPGDKNSLAEFYGVEMVRLSVSDTGCGMTEATQQQIFDPFFTTKTQGRGTGLGLSIVHNIMENHGGKITVESAVGKGTTFRLYFRQVRGTMGEETIKGKHLKIGTGQRVLYIDDDEILIKVVTQQLRLLKYEITTCNNGRDGLQLIEMNPAAFDLLLVDHMMPQMDGEEVMRQVRRIRPDLPVVLTSSLVQSENIQRIRNAGALDFVCKPSTIEEMADNLHNIFAAIADR